MYTTNEKKYNLVVERNSNSNRNMFVVNGGYMISKNRVLLASDNTALFDFCGVLNRLLQDKEYSKVKRLLALLQRG